MTVITYRAGIMAADTGVWQGTICAGSNRKIVRLADGRLMACAGPSAAAQVCRLWIEGNGPKPELGKDEGFGALIAGHDGVERIDAMFRRYKSAEAKFYAEGAHFEFLMGAMAAGASAGEAVRLAIECGDSAAGDVQIERL